MKRRFDRIKILRNMEAQGFSLNLPESMKNGISFIRASTVEQLFEHVLIHPGEAASAHVMVSAATDTICHDCVSDEYVEFRDYLSGHSQFGNTLIESPIAAKEWQARVVANADAYCRAASMKHGPALMERLQPVFLAVNGYIAKLGDLNVLFEREFAFMNEVTDAERSEIDQLTFRAERILYLETDVTKLACTIVVRFCTEVEEDANRFQNKKPYRDGAFAARLILLVGHLRKKRLKYERSES